MARHVWARHEWARARARVGMARVPGWHGTARHEMNSEHGATRARVGFLWWAWAARHGPLAISTHGQYTVRSCYKMLTHCSHAPIFGVWRKLWNLSVPNKVKNFLWRATMNVLPTCDNLIRRRVEVMPICSFCNHQNETVLHALVDCAFARTCWISSSLGFVGHCCFFLN